MELPKELIEKVYQVISTAKADGKIRRGANESTKSVERGESKLIAYAADVSPQEIVMHFPILAKEKGISFVQIPSKAELGAAAGLPVGTAAISVVNPGESKKLLEEVNKSLNLLNLDKPKPAEKPAEKPVEKPVEKPAEEAPKEAEAEQPAEESKVEEAPATEETPKVEEPKVEEPKVEETPSEPEKEEVSSEEAESEKAEPTKEPEEAEADVEEKAKPEEEPKEENSEEKEE